MKKKLLLLCLLFVAIIVHGQTPSTPNGDFEQWTSGTCDNLQYYPNNSNMRNFFRLHLPFNVVKTTDAFHGTYAAQVSTNATATDTSFGYFINANVDGPPSSWKGGMACSEKPTGIRGYYTYNLATVDSGTVLVSFSKAGVNVGTYMFTIGGVHNTYTLFDFNFNPALPVTPDSVIFGVLSCKLGQDGPVGVAGGILKIDSVSFKGVSAQPALMDGDFELWNSQTFYSPNNWYLQTDNALAVSRSNDAKGGTYAIELQTYRGDRDGKPAAQAGSISTGYYSEKCNNCPQQGGYPFSNQIDTLAFWYKYAPMGNDSAVVFLDFKKNGAGIFGKGMSLHAAATYQYMEIPFNVGQKPDSVIVQFQSSSWNDTLLSFVGSNLKIDQVHFKSQSIVTNIFNYKNEGSLSIFPNPTSGKIHIQNSGPAIQNLEVYNVLGENIYKTSFFKQQTTNELDLSIFGKGIYFVKFIYENESAEMKTVIMQ
ncbi:MAG TPA: T9SS type A sorting domain-containing protein [Bacteroidia bacterium]|jgi:hypothetical protein|nr:T9SS type A sorting domain-containing protein [Bacteroidia bacterium]